MNKVKKISRNPDLNLSPKYLVVFIARDSPHEDGGKKFPGHAYVVWATVHDNMSENFEAKGFYPPDSQEDFRKIELDQEGALMDEYRASAPGPNLDVSRLEVLVTKQMFDYSKQAIKDWDQKDIEYRFFVNNCVGFAAEVARSLGLNAPSGTYTTPRSFLDDLIDDNN